MENFIPANNTIKELEFVGAHNTITIENTEEIEYQLTDGSYTCASGATFDDINLVFNNTNSFSYNCKFKYAVPRKTYYSMVSEDHNTLTMGVVNNIYQLPAQYDVLYRVDNPPTSTTVTFSVNGQYRESRIINSPSTGEDGDSEPQRQWGPWKPYSTQYTITVTTNLQIHMQLIKESTKRGKYASNSPYRPLDD